MNVPKDLFILCNQLFLVVTDLYQNTTHRIYMRAHVPRRMNHILTSFIPYPHCLKSKWPLRSVKATINIINTQPNVYGQRKNLIGDAIWPLEISVTNLRKPMHGQAAPTQLDCQSDDYSMYKAALNNPSPSKHKNPNTS